jgi:hypothetical protein
VHAGQLPMRYVLGLRGPQLVFQPFEVAHWQAARTSAGEVRARSGARSKARQARARSNRVPNVESLLATVEEMSTSITALSRRLASQESKRESANLLLVELARRLEERDEGR